MKDLFVVTHAQSVHHIEKKVGGWFDTGLTEQGQQDALFVAAALLSAIGDKEVEIYSSDLKRASQTADIIANHFERPVTTTKSLREISYGVAEGRPQEWLDARYEPAPDDDRLDHHGNIEGAESRRDVANRVYPFLDAISQCGCRTQIIVTHGFTLSLVVAAWMRIPIAACGFIYFAAPSCSVTHLRQDDFFRNRAMIRLADVSHLAR